VKKANTRFILPSPNIRQKSFTAPNAFSTLSLQSLLASSTFTETQKISVNARIFHVGNIDGKKVVVVQCGLTHVSRRTIRRANRDVKAVGRKSSFC
jgi:hypothetical protein